jgi:hydroxylaminobenzene mutase
MQDAQRRLIWHGVFLVLVALLGGALLPSFRNPRLGLSAHVGGVMNGTLVALIGTMWGHLSLSPRRAAACFWSTVYSGYANWAGLLLAAVFGTSSTTPMLGAGHSGTPAQEALVGFLLVSGGAFVLLACLLVLAGLSRKG